MPDANYAALQFWLSALLAVINVGALVVGFFSIRNKATAAEIREVKNEFQKISERITTLETTAKSAPTHKDLGEIHEKINTVNSAVDKMSGVLSGIVNQLQLLIEHHLQREKSR